MNWFQQLGANIFGLNDYIVQQWGSDLFMLDPNADFTNFSNDRLKVQAVFSNPAILKVFKLQCDMFSMGEVYVYRNGKEVPNDPFITLINNPNPFQQKSQLLWDYMFWKMIGNAYCYVDSDSAQSDTNKMYMMDSYKMLFPSTMNAYRDKIVLSKATEAAINDLPITYNYSDGTSQQIKWGRITFVPDLSNGTGNWFRGPSSIDALYQIIANSKASPRSKNVTVRFAGKYMVAGQQDPNNVQELPMSEPERQDIESKMNGVKTVHGVKSMIDIKRFVENSAVIEDLDKSYWDDYFKVGSLFGIPRDVLEASLSGSTYENQEIARGAHVDYTLQPAGDQFMNALTKRFGYSTKSIVIKWDHLPFTQASAKLKNQGQLFLSQALINFMKAGVKVDEINSNLGTSFTSLDYATANAAPVQAGTSKTSGGKGE
jgi:hypothetical protein